MLQRGARVAERGRERLVLQRAEHGIGVVPGLQRKPGQPGVIRLVRVVEEYHAVKRALRRVRVERADLLQHARVRRAVVHRHADHRRRSQQHRQTHAQQHLHPPAQYRRVLLFCAHRQPSRCIVYTRPSAVLSAIMVRALRMEKV